MSETEWSDRHKVVFFFQQQRASSQKLGISQRIVLCVHKKCEKTEQVEDRRKSVTPKKQNKTINKNKHKEENIYSR